jgi:antitoxin YefM
MYTIYRMNTNELDNRFLKALKTMFKDKEIEIAISETSNQEADETEYLLKSPANREHLLKAIENIAHNRDLITIDLGEIK